MIFGMIFEHIGDDIDPREIKQFCNDPNKIADLVINKLKSKVGDPQKLCSRFEEREASCNKMIKKGCSNIGTFITRPGESEFEKTQAQAYTCPLNKDAIIKACGIRNKNYFEQRLKNIDETCNKRFDFEGERFLKECERFKQGLICDREKYISNCIINSGVRNEEGKPIPCPLYPTPKCFEGQSLKSKIDGSGCTYYYCETSTLCAQDVQQCPDGSYVKRTPPNCNFEQCMTIKCLEVSRPTCATGENLQPNYGSSGCITNYQCIKQQITCQEQQKPTCAQGQNLVTKTDSNGCISYYCEGSTTTTLGNQTAPVTGSAVATTEYEAIKQHCENSWLAQEKSCEGVKVACNKDVLLEKCKEQETENYGNFVSSVEKNCAVQTVAEIKTAEQRCGRLEDDKKHCLEYGTKRCEQMKGVAKNCREFLTEEKIRNFILEEVKKRCKFKDIIEDEEQIRKAEKAEVILAVLNTVTKEDLEKLSLFVDNLKEQLKLQDTTVYRGIIDPNRFGDIKLLPFVVNAKITTATSSERSEEVKTKIVAGEKVQEVASKLASLRDSGVPKEYLYLIEDKASDVLNVSENLNNLEKKEEGKGLGYKFRLFFGLAKQAEQEEINQLLENKKKLTNSIEVLTKLSNEVPSDVAKVILKEQVESLKKQLEDIESLIETKERKAKGLFGIFG